jgi:DNA ligase-associated metallophosphoesterase
MNSNKNEVITVQLNGIDCLLHFSGLLFIPKFHTIVISDIHFEKSFAVNILQSSTIPLPPFDTFDILVTIKKFLKYFSPKKIVFLGDTFHNLISAEYISKKNKNLIIDLIRLYDCVWIKGNHDLYNPKWLDAEPVDEYEEYGITFRHISKFEENEISGHYHLKTKIKTKDKSIVGKCFIHNSKMIIMPSFGIFTGGLYLKEFIKKYNLVNQFKIGFIYKSKIYNYNLKAVIK